MLLAAAEEVEAVAGHSNLLEGVVEPVGDIPAADQPSSHLWFHTGTLDLYNGCKRLCYSVEPLVGTARGPVVKRVLAVEPERKAAGHKAHNRLLTQNSCV